MCGGHGRSVFAAACLAVSRYFATAGLRSAALHTCVKGSAQAVKPDVCRCAALKNKVISSHTVSTNCVCALAVVCALFLTLIRKFSKTAAGCRLDDGGSEWPEGASRATDADSAPWARSSLAASSAKSSTDSQNGIAEVNPFHRLQNWHRRRGVSALHEH